MSQENKTSKKETDKKTLYIVVGVLVFASLAFRLIDYKHFEQTSILFVGLPALITILIVKFSGTPNSAYGVVFKTITLFLLMSAILFGEGLVCILFAAPIFYGVATIIVFINEYVKKKNSDKMYSWIIIPAVVLLMQPFGINTYPKDQIVTSTHTFNKEVSISDLNKAPNIQDGLPNFFKIGFPKPLDIEGASLEEGSTKNIRFESSTKGIGTLVLEVESKTDSTVTFKIAEDSTHINHWLTWKKIHVSIDKEGDQSTVTWTSIYTCDLGPQWYFEPLEKIAVEKMNLHLINSYFNAN